VTIEALSFSLSKHSILRLGSDHEVAISYIDSSLVQIHQHVNKFGAAIRLFNYAEAQKRESKAQLDRWVHADYPQPDNFMERFNDLMAECNLFEQWLHIAARDGAWTIYHFGKTLEQIRAWAKPIERLLDMESQVAAGKALREHFPRFETVRHALAHSSELMRPEVRAEHSLSGPRRTENVKIGDQVRDVWLSGNLECCNFSINYENERFSYALNEASLLALRGIMLLLFAAFRPISYNFPEQQKECLKP